MAFRSAGTGTRRSTISRPASTISGSRLRVDLGFVPQVGYQQFNAEAGYRMYPNGLLSFARLFAFGEYLVDHQGDVISRAVTPLGFFILGKKNLQAFTGLSFGTFRTGPELLTRRRLNYFVQVDPSRKLTRLSLQGALGRGHRPRHRPGWQRRRGDPECHPAARTAPHPRRHRVLDPGSAPRTTGRSGRQALLRRRGALKATYNPSARAYLRLIGQYTSSRRYLETGFPRMQASLDRCCLLPDQLADRALPRLRR